MVLYAVARLGAVILPLDWRWTGPEKRRVAEYFGVALVVVEAGAELVGVASIEVDGAWQ